MSDRFVFLDTNILVYSFSITDKVKYQKSVKVIRDNSCYISTQVINEFCNVSIKKLGASISKVKKATKDFELYFNVFTVNKNTSEMALDILGKYGYAYYDSLILASAIESGCSILYSEDLQHGQIIEKSLKIVNPFVV